MNERELALFYLSAEAAEAARKYREHQQPVIGGEWGNAEDREAFLADKSPESPERSEWSKRFMQEFTDVMKETLARAERWRLEIERRKQIPHTFRKGEYVFCWRESWSPIFTLGVQRPHRIESTSRYDGDQYIKVYGHEGHWPSSIFLKMTPDEVRRYRAWLRENQKS